MSTERDTHFANFAKLLMEELPETPVDDSILGIAYADWKEASTKVIAQRAYDLVLHTAYHISIRDLESLLMTEIVEKIPDMTSFPD